MALRCSITCAFVKVSPAHLNLLELLTTEPQRALRLGLEISNPNLSALCVSVVKKIPQSLLDVGQVWQA
jgi:hypothetical protein